MSLKDDLESKKNEIKSEIEQKAEAIKSEISETKQEISESIEKGIKKTWSFTKRLIWSIILLGIVAGGIYLFWCNMTYSEGSRTGYLMKVSKKGYVIKTLEGEMNMGGFQEDNTTLVGNTWYFSIPNEKIYNELIQKQGKKLMLHYREKNRAMPWQGDTNYFVYKVEER